jgi:hypothetical protein
LPTDEEVFKQVQDSYSTPTDPKKFIAVICAIVGVAVLAAVLSNRTKRKVLPKTLNHQGELLKEVMRTVDLRPAEVKQLKILADDQNVSSPLTLVLCPSVLAKAVKSKAGKVDRKVLMSVARKLG